MARVTITRRWCDEVDELEVAIDVDTNYPDALAEGVRSGLNAFTEALVEVLTAEAPDEQP